MSRSIQFDIGDSILAAIEITARKRGVTPQDLVAQAIGEMLQKLAAEGQVTTPIVRWAPAEVAAAASAAKKPAGDGN